ncbi:MAG: SGNH/GDSL hydrolase family protein [Moraxella sp.]|nr:SGNH/GDSL hydrolase family protein [Moraxella sp.]
MTLLHTTQDYLLAPIYYAQAKKVAKTALRLPEPTGVRIGTTAIDTAAIDTTDTSSPKNTLNLAIFGDSAGAGVGVDSQDDAPLGRIVAHLVQLMTSANPPSPFKQIHWQLHATSGHTSFDLLTRLYAMPAIAFDVAVISIGVNDVIKQSTNAAWQHHLHEIITLLQRKFAVRDIIFLSLPPMQLAPSLPSPLNRLIGRRAMVLSQLMQAVCTKHANVHYLQDEFYTNNLTYDKMFAKDGFHPSKHTYQVWSQTIAHKIITLIQLQ